MSRTVEHQCCFLQLIYRPIDFDMVKAALDSRRVGCRSTWPSIGSIVSVVEWSDIIGLSLTRWSWLQGFRVTVISLITRLKLDDDHENDETPVACVPERSTRASH